MFRAAAAGMLLCLLGVMLYANTARALNLYRDAFVTLSAEPLSMGGAFCAMTGPASVFYNPAGLAGVRRLTLMHNHSARHFPGSSEGGLAEWDQLDADTQAVVVPLPLSTYAHGFTFAGEMGYDYRGHPAGGSLGYPRERYWGKESYDAVAVSTGLPFAAGISLRQHLGRFTPAGDDPAGLAWIRLGEGTQWGILARVWPSLDYGYSELKMDYDWTILAANGQGGGNEFAKMTSREKVTRSGWALHPTAWLTLAQDEVTETYDFDEEAGLGSLHRGDETIRRQHRGGELCLGALAKLRWGSYDGHATIGVALNLGGVWLNYAEVEGLLPGITGAGSGFEDLHIYGFELNLW